MGDSLGPLVGTYLKNNSNFEIYGDMEKNLYAKEDIINIYSKIYKKYVIVIDSAVSDIVDIGEIFISNNKCKIGAGISNLKINIGDMSIKAVVARKNQNKNITIENLRKVNYKFVEELSKKIGKSICNINLR